MLIAQCYLRPIQTTEGLEKVRPEDLLERIHSSGNLRQAWLREGQWPGGWDGRDAIAQFPAFARQYWEKIRLRLMPGTYHPAPVRRVFLPNPMGNCVPKIPRGDLFVLDWRG